MLPSFRCQLKNVRSIVYSSVVRGINSHHRWSVLLEGVMNLVMGSKQSGQKVCVLFRRP